ncbi:MAG: 3-hydroxyacyl-ACP dehydratase FabZ [Rhodobacteraceae bacterium]|nr:3-hydroxyacyl-ACP dehydratase FabZ [Paracoccaceae bacterium]
MIQRMIPHRYPFLMVDKVIVLEKGKSAIGIKNVTVNEPYFEGHFPGNPVMPGVSIIEAMAQAAAVLVNYTLDMIDKKIGVYLTAVDKARFRRMVVPGDVLELHIEAVRSRKTLWKFECEGRVEGQAAAQAEISAFWEPREPGQ